MKQVLLSVCVFVGGGGGCFAYCNLRFYVCVFCIGWSEVVVLLVSSSISKIVVKMKQ